MRVVASRASRVPLVVDSMLDLQGRTSHRLARGDFYESVFRLKGAVSGTFAGLRNSFAYLEFKHQAHTSANGGGLKDGFLAVEISNNASASLHSCGFSRVVLYFYTTDSTLTLLVFLHLQTSARLLSNNEAATNENFISSANFAAWTHFTLDLQAFLSGTLGLRGFVRFSCCPGRTPRRSLHILFTDCNYNLGFTLLSVFNFLRYTGPRRLRKARRVLRDDETYHITHIGQGAFAWISRVLYKPTGEVRVMKRITVDETGLAEYLAKNEIYGLKTMKESIWFPALLNDFVENEEYVVTMPYYHGGDLAAFIEHKRLLGRDVAQFYCAQLLLAIQSLHKHGIVHRDIKTDNIFLDDTGHLVLADLGLAENIAIIEGGEDTIKERYPAWMEARSSGGDSFPFLWADESNPLGMKGVAGTFWYTAPEVFRKERYSFGVDYWSLGVIYHELITGHTPFEFGIPYPEHKRPILDFGRKSGQLKDIAQWEEDELRQLLAGHPSERPRSVRDIKNLRIFQGVDWKGISQKRVPPPRLPLPLKEDDQYTQPFWFREHDTLS